MNRPNILKFLQSIAIQAVEAQKALEEGDILVIEDFTTDIRSDCDKIEKEIEKWMSAS